jgi:glycosyltransferase involved in cell wall biosynthesis
MDSKVSIVIPVYNGSNFLGEAIESALGQTYKNIEVIVVNDGSADDGATRRVAETYSARIRYFEKPNGGVASALNFGIAEMTGDYFSWLSHDDLYLPEKIESQLECLANCPHDREAIVYGNCAVFTRDPALAKEIEAPDAHRKYFRYLLTTSSAVNGCTLLIPKSAFREHRFDEAKPTTQDYDMWFKLAKEFDFIKVDKTLVLSRQHPAQDSVKKRRRARSEKNMLCGNFVSEMTAADINPAGGITPVVGYQRMAAHYARSGLAPVAVAAAKKSIACIGSSRMKEVVGVCLGLVFVCVFMIPLGLLRAWAGDVVRG